MDIIQGSGPLIVDARAGDTILVTLTNNKIETVVLFKVNRHGIEGYQVNLSTRPLTFYPFPAIIKITKFNEVQGQNDNN